MSTKVDTAQTNSQHFELASNEIKDNQELYEGTDVVGESTYAKEVQLEQFFDQLEGVQDKVEVNKKQIYRGFIRFNEETKGGKTKVVLESVNTKNWKFKNLIPLKWRTNLKDMKHNQSLRTTLSMAALKKFKGLSLGKDAKLTLLGNVADSKKIINAGAATVNKESFHTLVAKNTTKALEREEVGALRERYFDITCKKDGLKELAKSTLLKIAAVESLDLLQLPADLAESYFKDYLHLDHTVFGDGTVGDKDFMKQQVLDKLIDKLLAGTDYGKDNPDFKPTAAIADANLNKIRENLEEIKSTIKRASANVQCRNLLNLGVNDKAGPMDAATRIRPKVANQIAELLTTDFCDAIAGKNSGITLSQQEIERAVKLFCKVSPGDGKLCCLQRSMQKILKEFLKEIDDAPENKNLSDKDRAALFYEKCKSADILLKLRGEAEKFVRGYQSIKNFVGDAFTKAELPDIDAMALKMATARYGNDVSDGQVAIVRNQLQQTFVLMGKVKEGTTKIAEICQTEVGRFQAKVPKEKPLEKLESDAAVPDLGDDEKKQKFFETCKQDLSGKIEACDGLLKSIEENKGKEADWQKSLQKLGVAQKDLPTTKDKIVAKARQLKDDFGNSLKILDEELKQEQKKVEQQAEQPKIEQQGEQPKVEQQAGQPKVEQQPEPQVEQKKAEAEPPKDEVSANVPDEKADDEPVAPDSFGAQRFLTEMLQDEYVQWYAERYYPTDDEKSAAEKKLNEGNLPPMDYDFVDDAQQGNVGNQNSQNDVPPLNLALIRENNEARARENAKIRQGEPKSPEEFLIERHYLPSAPSYDHERNDFVAACKRKLIEGAANEIARTGFKYGIGPSETDSFDNFTNTVDSKFRSGELKEHAKELEQTGELTDEDFKDLPVNKNGIMHLYNIGMAAKNWYNVISSVKKVATGGTSISNVTNLPGVVTSLIAAVKQTNKAYKENRADELEYLRKVSDGFFDKKVFKNFYGVKDPGSVYNRLKDKLVAQAFLQKVGEDSKVYNGELVSLERFDIDYYRERVESFGDRGYLFNSKLKAEVDPDQLARTLSKCVNQIADEFNKENSKGFLGLFKGSLRKTVQEYRETLKNVGPEHMYLLIGGTLPPKPPESDPQKVREWHENWQKTASEFVTSGADAIFREMAVLNFQGELNRAFERAIDMFAAEMVKNDAYLAVDQKDPHAGKGITDAGLERLRGLIRTECAKVKVLQNEELVKVMTKDSPLIQTVISTEDCKTTANFEKNADKALDSFYEAVLDKDDVNDYKELKAKRNELTEEKYEAARSVKLFAAMQKKYPDMMQIYSTISTFEMYLKAGKLKNLYNSLLIGHNRNDGVLKFVNKFGEEAVKSLKQHSETAKKTIGTIQNKKVEEYFGEQNIGENDYKSLKYKRYVALVKQATVHVLSADNEAFEAFMDMSNIGGEYKAEDRTFLEWLFGTKKFATKEVAKKILNNTDSKRINEDGYSFNQLLSAKIDEMKKLLKTEGLGDKLGKELNPPKEWSEMVTKFVGACEKRKQSNLDHIRNAFGTLADYVKTVYKNQILADVDVHGEFYWGSDEELAKTCNDELEKKVNDALKKLAGKISKVPATGDGKVRGFFAGSEHEQLGKILQMLQVHVGDSRGLSGAATKLLEGDEALDISSDAFKPMLEEIIENRENDTQEKISEVGQNAENFMNETFVNNWNDKIKAACEGFGLKENELALAVPKRDTNFFTRVYVQDKMNDKGTTGRSGTVKEYQDALDLITSDLKRRSDLNGLIDEFIKKNGLENDSVDKKAVREALDVFIATNRDDFVNYVKAVCDLSHAKLVVGLPEISNAEALVNDWVKKVDLLLQDKLKDKIEKVTLKNFAESVNKAKGVQVTDMQIEKMLKDHPGFTVPQLKRMIAYQAVKGSMKTFVEKNYGAKEFNSVFADELNPELSSREYEQDAFNPLIDLIKYDSDERQQLVKDFQSYVVEHLDELHKKDVRNEQNGGGGKGLEGEEAVNAERKSCEDLIAMQFKMFCSRRHDQRVALNRMYVDLMTNKALGEVIDQMVLLGSNTKEHLTLRNALKTYAYNELLGCLRTKLKAMEFRGAGAKTLMTGKLFETTVLNRKEFNTAEVLKQTLKEILEDVLGDNPSNRDLESKVVKLTSLLPETSNLKGTLWTKPKQNALKKLASKVMQKSDHQIATGYTIRFAQQEISVVLNKYKATVWTAVIAKTETLNTNQTLLKDLDALEKDKKDPVEFKTVEAFQKYMKEGSSNGVRLIFNAFDTSKK